MGGGEVKRSHRPASEGGAQVHERDARRKGRWAAWSAPARAGLRCGHDLVQEGEPSSQLLLVCSEPAVREIVAVENTSETEGIVEQWAYDPRPGTLLQIVTIEAGVVAKIEDGARR